MGGGPFPGVSGRRPGEPGRRQAGPPGSRRLLRALRCLPGHAPADGSWDTGLLTTEGSQEAFTVRSGDVLEARVRLPGEIGAWPAIWTWRDGDQEIDVFEYHPEHPDRVRGTLGRWVGERRSGLRGPAGSGAPLARLPHRQPLGLRGPLSPGARRGDERDVLRGERSRRTTPGSARTPTGRGGLRRGPGPRTRDGRGHLTGADPCPRRAPWLPGARTTLMAFRVSST